MTTHADIEAAWRSLGSLATGIVPAKIPNDPTPDEIRYFGNDLRLLARHVDALVKAYADHFTKHTGEKVAKEYTDDQLFGALDGNLLYHIEDAAECLELDAAQ